MSDKTNWGEGPWMSEPDRLEFRAHGLPCLLRRSPRMGSWCGYVGVSPGHPWHGKGFNELEAVDAHGGVTFGEACDGDPVDGICHVPQPGEPEHAWWIGFDFGHAGDLSPGFESRHREEDPMFTMASTLLGIGEFGGDGDHYWTLSEARAETERVAEQAASAVTP